ncbi:phosphatase PAP2 family protein [Myceligenerans pegani]|uniref:phosphatase PAP2 family protein n=1 Tax=Myceligenerans pegani TaxID=2776917 RepID=UPI00299EA29A|nr:phosphatase PAP2 family protein [Myceligenerans sp. TRM 65318]
MATTAVQLTSPARPGGRRSRGARIGAAVVALISAVGVWAVWRVMVVTWSGQRTEEAAFEGADRFQDALARLADPVLELGGMRWLVVGSLVAVAVALVRGRWLVAGQVAVLIAGANVTTQVVKAEILYRPDHLVGWNSGVNTLPSGHTTVAASVWAGLLLAAPRRLRPLVAVGGAAATSAMAVATIVDRWHRPSDVVAAVLVVLAWGALLCALTPRSALDRPGESDGGGFTVTVAVLLGAGALVTAVVAVPAIATVAGFGPLPTSGLMTAYAGAVLAVLSASLATTAALLVVRQATARPR